MTPDIISTSTQKREAIEASAALRAIAVLNALQPAAIAENTRQVAMLSEWADGTQQAEHIRGMVAATMAHMSMDADAVTRENAGKWQSWAQEVADALDAPVVAPVTA